jgi:pyrimidine operon attenuation protein/uracil phosphoribosyltransferase
MTSVASRQILTSLQTQQKIRRIAFEVYEKNFEEKEIIIAGITGEGYEFARRLAEELQSISSIAIKLTELSFDKHAPHQSEVEFIGEPLTVLDNQVVLVVDDVLNTGQTLTFGLKPFLKYKTKKIQIAVIVDRGHRCYPISPDYKGYSLSTTINERVEVVLSRSEDEGVYLR